MKYLLKAPQHYRLRISVFGVFFALLPPECFTPFPFGYAQGKPIPYSRFPIPYSLNQIVLPYQFGNQIDEFCQLQLIAKRDRQVESSDRGQF